MEDMSEKDFADHLFNKSLEIEPRNARSLPRFVSVAMATRALTQLKGAMMFVGSCSNSFLNNQTLNFDCIIKLVVTYHATGFYDNTEMSHVYFLTSMWFYMFSSLHD